MTDRRTIKSQDAIKEAFIQLMSKKNFEQITVQNISDKANVGRRTFYHHYQDKYDLLTKLIEEHINDLRNICKSAIDDNLNEPPYIWFDYFENNYQFFSTMLRSKELFAFRSLLLDFVIEELKKVIDISQGKNKGLSEDIYFRFFGSAIVGIIESYFTKGIPKLSKDLAEEVQILLDRNI